MPINGSSKLKAESSGENIFSFAAGPRRHLDTLLLDRIYRIFRILSQFPEETEKTQSASSGVYGNFCFLASKPPDSHMLCNLRFPFELSAFSFELIAD
jgi:hypothetical protein